MEAAANRIQPVVLRRLEVRDRCSDMDRGSQLFRVACRSFPEVRGSDACCRSQRQASRAQGLPNQKEKIGIGLRCSWPDCGRCYRDRKSSFAGKTTQGARGCGFQPQSWSIEIVFSIQARRASAQASGSSAQWATFLLLSAKDSVIAQTNHSLAHRACTHSLARRAGTESAIHFKYDALPSTIGVTMISGSSYECISWIVVMTAATCFFVVFTEQQCSTDD